MDKDFILKVIRDFETIQKVVSTRLAELKAMVGDSTSKPIKNDMSQEIEKRKSEMMAEMERIRQEALASAQASMSQIPKDMPMAPGGIPGMPGGMPTVPGAPPFTPETIKQWKEIKKSEEKDGKKE